MHFFTLRHLFIPIPDLSDLTQQTDMFFLFQISEEPDCNTHHGDQLQQTLSQVGEQKAKSRFVNSRKLLGKSSLKKSKPGREWEKYKKARRQSTVKTITYPKKFHHFPFNNSLEPLIPAEIDRFSSII